MIKQHLQKFWIFLISGLTIATITVFACAGGEWDPFEGSMFTPEIINQPKYTPFFRTLETPFYDGYDDDCEEQLKQENCKDWCAYLSNNATKDVVNYWLYDASINQIDSMVLNLKNKTSNLTAKSMQYSLKKLKADNKSLLFLEYLTFAKNNEEFVVSNGNNWNNNSNKVTNELIVDQIKNGANYLAKINEPFLKERYVFQLERLYFFNGEYDNAIKLFNDNESNFKSSNSIKWRAIGYKAGALYKQKKYSQANYLFSKIYDGYEPLKKSAYLSFHTIQQADWEECLNLAKTTHEKEVLWQLFGLYADNVFAMKEIVKLNPNSELLDLLIVRAVNMEEEKFSDALNDTATKQNMSTTLDDNLVAFLNEMSLKSSIKNPVIWQLSAAYLNYIKKDYTTADKQIALAEKLVTTNSLLNSQFHLIRTVGAIIRIEKLNATIEKNLLADLKVVFSPEKKDSSFRYSYAQNWIRNTLANLCIKNGEQEKAELINGGKNPIKFINTTNLKNMIAYLEKENKTEFENFFAQVSNYSKLEYQQLLAIRYTQEDNLKEALAIVKKIPIQNVEFLGNPFTIHIKDCHDCDHAAKQKTKYSSTSFIEKLLEMKNTAISKPEEAAQNYFLIANGFYNMTYFGNARVFYDNRLNNDIYYFEYDNRFPELNCDLALKYYVLAKEKSTNKEFQAKCIFMAAKCEQNKFFVNKSKNDNSDFRSGVYFAFLSKQFSATKYYQEILKECSYFKQYESQH